jgi:integrase
MYRTRRTVNVHPHQSGRWRFTCGKTLNATKTKLVPRDFYLVGTKEKAIAQATLRVKEWNFLRTNWATLYEPTLKLIDAPFAEVPHWQPAMGSTVSDTTIAAYQDRPPTDAEVADAYRDVTLDGVINLFNLYNEGRVRQGEVTRSTFESTKKRLKNASRFFNCTRPISDISHFEWMESKTALIEALGSRKSAKNYLDGLRHALTWFYDSPYGADRERIGGFKGIFRMTKVTSKRIVVYSADDLKRLLKHADDKIRLFVYLALNMGMYQADIAKLMAGEVNLGEGYMLWDRAKEPENPFQLMHVMWPETRRLVEKFWKPTGFGWTTKQIENAFRRHCKKHGLIFQFRNLRKTTNQLIGEMIGGNPDDDKAVAAEICTEFLGQRTLKLMERYRVLGTITYKRMNHYLGRAGDALRVAGVLS